MKELNLEYEQDINGTQLCLKIDSENDLDKTAYLVLQEDCPEFVIPMKKSVSDGVVKLKYQMNRNFTALKYSESMKASKDEFISMMLSFVEPLLNGADWFLKAGNFVIDNEYIFLDRSKNFFFLYAPLKEDLGSTSEILDFVKQLAFNVEITDDPRFQISLMRLFEDANANLLMVKNFLEEEKSKNVRTVPKEPVKKEPAKIQEPAKVNTVEQPKEMKVNSTSEPKVAESKKAPIEKTIEKQKESTGETKELSAHDLLFGDGAEEKKKDKKGLFHREEKQEKPQKEKFNLFGRKKDGNSSKENNEPEPKKEPKPERVFEPRPVEQFVEELKEEKKEVQADITSNDTFIFDDAISVSEKHLQLISSPVDGAPERISLEFEKNFVTLGRMTEDNRPDIGFPKSFIGIGRKQAIIEREGDTYYMVDTVSANGTFINGEQMIPNKKYPLTNGDVVTFTTKMPVKYKVCI